MDRMERIAALQLVNEMLERHLDTGLVTIVEHAKTEPQTDETELAKDVAEDVKSLYVLRQFMAREIQVAQAEAQAEEQARFDARGARH